jgi:putative endonuclease
LVPNIAEGQAVVYFLLLSSGTIYVGCSTDLDQRLDDHLCGQGCRTTQIDPPVAILRVEILPTFSDVRTREAQLKRWSRAKKQALVKGELERLHVLSQSREAVKPPCHTVL